MLRITEPELMTELEQVNVYAETDFSDSDGKMVSRLVELINESKKNLQRESLLIDLGCGPGNITQRLASHWPEINVVGIDGSTEMLRIARQRQFSSKNKSSLSGLSYKEGNISSLSKTRLNLSNFADVVVSNSFIHHVHDFKFFLKSLKAISKKGTLYFHRDLRRPLSSNQALDLQKKHLPNAHPIMIRDFIASLKAAFTRDEVVNYLEKSSWQNYKVIEVEDRYLDIIGVN